MRDFFSLLGALDIEGVLTILALSAYAPFVVGLAVFFLGETAIITTLLLAHQGLLGIETVFFSAVVGTLVADIFWFTVGRHFPNRFLPPRARRILINPIRDVFAYVTRDRIFFSIFFLKFFIGVRLAIILYLAHYPISFRRFLVYDTLGTILYMIVLTGITVLFGNALEKVFPTLHLVTSVFVGVLIIMCISFLARRMYGKLTLKENSNAS